MICSEYHVKDSLAAAESNLLDNAGRGTINTIVAGRRVAELMGTLPGFVRLTDGFFRSLSIVIWIE